MRHAVVWGRRLQGKSTLSLALAIASQHKPIIVFDPCDQFGYFPVAGSASEGIASGLEVFRIVGSGAPDAEFESLMADLDGGVWKWSDYALVLDEASLLQRPQQLHPALARLIRMGPDDVTVVETLHRPSETHQTVRALATDFFFFQTYAQRDLEVIASNYGPEVAVKVEALKQYEVLHWWLESGGTPAWKVWNDPALWRIEIGERTMVKDEPEEIEENIGDEPEPELSEAALAAPAPVASATTTQAAPAIDDPIETRMKEQDARIRRLERQNRKLRARFKQEAPEPLQPDDESDRVRTATYEPETRKPGLWDWLAGKD